MTHHSISFCRIFVDYYCEDTYYCAPGNNENPFDSIIIELPLHFSFHLLYDLFNDSWQ
jgi:hypothetical protein